MGLDSPDVIGYVGLSLITRSLADGGRNRDHRPACSRDPTEHRDRGNAGHAADRRTSHCLLCWSERPSSTVSYLYAIELWRFLAA
jgi:hypothetical protein